ncbi:MAG: hypothetical protein RIE73_28350 [Coleofasciculus sp. C1-SOL-03]
MANALTLNTSVELILNSATQRVTENCLMRGFNFFPTILQLD